MVPIDILLGTIHEHLQDLIPELDKLLNVPLGMHPENTPEAKRERWEKIQRIKAGDF